MIAYHSELYNGKVSIADSQGQNVRTDSLEAILDYLLGDSESQFKVAWDIDQFVAPLMKLMSKEALMQLKDTETTIGYYKIRYYMHKSLFIKKGTWMTSVYHLAQFFNGQEPESLQKVAQKGEQLISELHSIEIVPRRLSSPIALIDNVIDSLDLPDHNMIPPEVNQIAWKCTGRQWTEAHRLGYFSKAYDYDIVSSYPSVMAGLLDCRKEYGTWVQSKICPQEAAYGFAEGTAKVSKDISPLILIALGGHQYNTKGSWATETSLQIIRCLEQTGIGSFKVSNGWWWIPSRRVLPLQLAIHKLYKQRQLSPLLGKVLKGAMVGLYGLTGQRHSDGRLGHHFMPVWAGTIESTIQSRIAYFIYNNGLQKNLIHVSTDGTLLDAEVQTNGSGHMGEWRLDSSGEALVISSGVLFYGNKRPVQLTLPEALELVRAKPKASEWSKKIQRRMTLGDYLLNPRNDIGEVKTVETGLRLKLAEEHDRDFAEVPCNGMQLLRKQYSSKALLASQIRR